MTQAVWLQIALWKVISIFRTILAILQCCLAPGDHFMLYYIYIYILIYIFNIFPRNFCMTTAWHIPGCSKAAMSGAAVARSCYKRKRTVSASWKLSTTRPPDARILQYLDVLYDLVFSCCFLKCIFACFSRATCIFRRYAHLLPQSHDTYKRHLSWCAASIAHDCTARFLTARRPVAKQLNCWPSLNFAAQTAVTAGANV